MNSFGEFAALTGAIIVGVVLGKIVGDYINRQCTWEMYQGSFANQPQLP
jgi:hypothetical protein